MVREAAQEAINAIFDSEKPVNHVQQSAQPIPVNNTQAYSSASVSLGPVRYEGFGNGNAGGNFQGGSGGNFQGSGGNFQGGLKGISGPSKFEEDRSILSYASAAPASQYGNGSTSKMAGFGNSSSNSSQGFEGSKGIEVVKQVGAKAASILTAGMNWTSLTVSIVFL